MHSRHLPRFFITYDNLLTHWQQIPKKIQAIFDIPLPAISAETIEKINLFLNQGLRNHYQQDLKQIDLNPQLISQVSSVYNAVLKINQVDPRSKILSN